MTAGDRIVGKREHASIETPAATALDRRGGARHALVYRPMLIEGPDFSGFCLTKNLSATGMMGRFYLQCERGTQLTVHFNNFQSIKGLVAWSDTTNIGIQFSSPINVEETLAALAAPTLGGKVNRSPRLGIVMDGQAVAKDREVPFELRDISQKGIKVYCWHLRTGDEVNVVLEGLDPRRAIVKWTKDGFAGLTFATPLNFDLLGRWAIWRQMGLDSKPSIRSVEPDGGGAK